LVGILFALLAGLLMSVQGVFNTRVMDSSNMWAANSWVQLVAHDGTVPFEYQLADSAALDAELRTLAVLLHPVMKDAVVNLQASFFPHGFLQFST
jgi:hypothetical protein